MLGSVDLDFDDLAASSSFSSSHSPALAQHSHTSTSRFAASSGPTLPHSFNTTVFTFPLTLLRPKTHHLITSAIMRFFRNCAVLPLLFAGAMAQIISIPGLDIGLLQDVSHLAESDRLGLHCNGGVSPDLSLQGALISIGAFANLLGGGCECACDGRSGDTSD